MESSGEKKKKGDIDITVLGEVQTPMPPAAMGTGSYFVTEAGDDHDLELYRFSEIRTDGGHELIYGTRMPDLKVNGFDFDEVTVVDINAMVVTRKGVECMGVPVDAMMKAARDLSLGNTSNDPEIIRVVDMLIKMADDAKKAAE